MAADRHALPPYGEWKRPRSTRGLIAVNSGASMLAVAVSTAACIALLFTSSLLSIAVVTLTAVLIIAPLLWTRGGRTGWSWALARVRFAAATWRGQTSFRQELSPEARAFLFGDNAGHGTNEGKR